MFQCQRFRLLTTASFACAVHVQMAAVYHGLDLHFLRGGHSSWSLNHFWWRIFIPSISLFRPLISHRRLFLCVCALLFSWSRVSIGGAPLSYIEPDAFPDASSLICSYSNWAWRFRWLKRGNKREEHKESAKNDSLPLEQSAIFYSSAVLQEPSYYWLLS